MRSNTRTQNLDSLNPSAPTPRPYARVYWLTDAALAELASERCAPPVQDDQDEYAFTCIFCNRLIADCKCGTGQE